MLCSYFFSKLIVSTLPAAPVCIFLTGNASNVFWAICYRLCSGKEAKWLHSWVYAKFSSQFKGIYWIELLHNKALKYLHTTKYMIISPKKHFLLQEKVVFLP